MSKSKTEYDFMAKFQDVTKKLGVLSLLVKELQSDIKQIQKEVNKSQKPQNCSKGKKPKTKNGFKQCNISPEMCCFFSLAQDQKYTKTAITKMLHLYIRDNKLQDVNDKRRIIPNEALCRLMNLEPSDKLTYFKLQDYIKHHFFKL